MIDSSLPIVDSWLSRKVSQPILSVIALTDRRSAAKPVGLVLGDLVSIKAIMIPIVHAAAHPGFWSQIRPQASWGNHSLMVGVQILSCLLAQQ